MATFRNDTGDDLTIDRFGLYVPAGLTFEIPDEDADSLAGQSALVRVATDPDVLIPAEIVRDLTPDVDDDPADATSEPTDVAPAPAIARDPAPDRSDEPATAPVIDEPAPTTDAAAADAGSDPIQL